MIPLRRFRLAALASLALSSCKPAVRFDAAAPEQASPGPASIAAVTRPTDGAATLVRGEAHLFRGTKPLTMVHPVDRVVRLYSYDGQGRKRSYVQGKDWQMLDGTVRRMSGSAIPDFAGYRYSAQTGCEQGLFTRSCAISAACFVGLRSCPVTGPAQFDFLPEPRNPPLTITYNVYVDYVANLPATSIKARHEGLENARAVLCTGDSVTAGAHTVAQHYRGRDEQSWCALLRRNLPGVRFENRGESDSSVGAIVEQVERSSIKPDSVIVAFGMNDHVAGSGGLQRFTKDLTRSVSDLRKRNIRILLVGFFQQNGLWVRENPADTLAYNRAIAQVARDQGVPFVDMGGAFGRLSREAPAGQQLTADFMHHPNLYGQRIYFSRLFPHFLRKDRPAADVADYVVGAD